MISGLLILSFYLILLFKKANPLLATGAAVILGFIVNMTQPLVIGTYMADALGSFMAVIGFIIMLGRGLGELLHETGISQTLIYVLTSSKLLKTKNSFKLSIIVTTMLIVGLLGTLAGGLAILAPSLRSIAAKGNISKPTLAILMQAAAEEGLILGPLTPPVLTMLAITQISYFDLMVYVSLPIAITTLLVSWFNSIKYDKIYACEKIEEQFTSFIPSNQQIRLSIIFIIIFISLIIFSITIQAKSNFVIIILLLLCMIIGFMAKYTVHKTWEIVQNGMQKQFHLYLLFILLDPLMKLIDNTGIFQEMLGWFLKYQGSDHPAIILLITGLTGTVGMPGAAESTMLMLHKVFWPLAQHVQISPIFFAYPLVFATRMTNYLYPGANMFAAMGAASSENLLAIVKNGWTVVLCQTIIFLSLLLYYFQ